MSAPRLRVCDAMSLHLHRAERADRLVRALGEMLSTPLPDPFATEIVSVPTPGVERWLAQRLSHQLGATPEQTDGICAGVEFPSPRRLVARAVATTGPADEVDPWSPTRLVWPLLRVIDQCRGEPWARLLWSYLGDRRGPSGAPETDPVRGGRRWSTARHLADLFAAYAARRPAMITSWAAGRDVDAAGQPLPPDRAWQAELWRRLRAELDLPDPVERVGIAAAVLRSAPERSDLPERISVFGPTRLEPDHLLVLDALAEHRDVHLWLPHPSPVLWTRISEHLAADGQTASGRPRAADSTDRLVEHQLLAYLGRDTRELQLGLGTVARVASDQHYPAPATVGPLTLLHRLQADIAADRSPLPPADRPLLSESDRSVQLHSSHGPDRQVEVLREVLVGLLADDETLQPRDIVVMCPDIETFAPLIAAAFGLDTDETSAEHPGHRLRVRLADRSLRQINPLLALLTTLVGLAESRMEASALLDLCSAVPVARKFGFGVDDLERLHVLVSQSGVRWGLDTQQRARFGMADFGQNTWAAGLDRLLLGVAMDETDQHFIGTTLPLDDVDAGDVDLIGRLAECLSRVRSVTAACAIPRPVAGWIELFRRALDLLASVSTTDSWQLTHAHHELGRLAEAAAGDAIELALPEVSALLADAFRGRASRANFRTGTLTMCTMLPMRSVPHRVVCLLGVDDGVFPRSVRLDGDDIAADQPWVGDRDPRSEDRQLLLDAVLAAQERLLVIFAGTDPRTGEPTPPAVPVGALLDTLDQTARTADGRPIRKAVTVRHPLQPFARENFRPKDGNEPFSFDQASLRGVRAAGRERTDPAPVFTTADLPPLPVEQSVLLADLIRFYRHPIRALIKDRAALSYWSDDAEPDEQIPAELSGLDRWAVGERLLRLHLGGADLADLCAAEWRRGTVPPRNFGQRALEELAYDVAAVAKLARPFMTGPVDRREIVADLGASRLTGTVPGLYSDHLVRVTLLHPLGQAPAAGLAGAPGAQRQLSGHPVARRHHREARPVGARADRGRLGGQGAGRSARAAADRPGRADPVRAEDVGGICPDPVRQASRGPVQEDADPGVEPGTR